MVRSLNIGFPEGIMLAILFGNCFAPLIDYFVVEAEHQTKDGTQWLIKKTVLETRLSSRLGSAYCVRLWSAWSQSA